MKIDCDVARDLMPLVVDGTASMKSCAMVDEHVGTCEPCREMLEEMRQEVETGVPKEDAGPLVKKLRRRRLLRRALLVLLSVVICAALAVVGWQVWNYHYNDFRMVTADENYDLEIVQDDVYGMEIVLTILDGHAQTLNTYIDEKTGDLYFWSTTTRKPVSTGTDKLVYQETQLFYFDDLGYGFVKVTYDWGKQIWYIDVVPVNRVIKGAPDWYTDTPHTQRVMDERTEPVDEALIDAWRARLETTDRFNAWLARKEAGGEECVLVWETE